MLKHFCLFFPLQSTSHCIKTMNLHANATCLGLGNSPSAACCLDSTASYSRSNTSINLSLMTFWHSNQFIRCSCTGLLPRSQAKVPGHSWCIMHEPNTLLSTLWQIDTSAVHRPCVANSSCSPSAPHHVLRAVSFCSSSVLCLGEAGQSDTRCLGSETYMQQCYLGVSEKYQAPTILQGLREDLILLIQT